MKEHIFGSCVVGVNRTRNNADLPYPSDKFPARVFICFSKGYINLDKAIMGWTKRTSEDRVKLRAHHSSCQSKFREYSVYFSTIADTRRFLMDVVNQFEIEEPNAILKEHGRPVFACPELLMQKAQKLFSEALGATL